MIAPISSGLIASGFSSANTGIWLRDVVEDVPAGTSAGFDGPSGEIARGETDDSADDSVGEPIRDPCGLGLSGSDSSSLRMGGWFCSRMTMVAFKELSNESDVE